MGIRCNGRLIHCSLLVETAFDEMDSEAGGSTKLCQVVSPYPGRMESLYQCHRTEVQDGV